MMTRPKASRQKARYEDDVPAVFRDMLADTVTSTPARSDDEARASKRRRIGGRLVTKASPNLAADVDAVRPNVTTDEDLGVSDHFEEPKISRSQIMKTESEDSASDDMDWEEVDLQHRDGSDQSSKSDKEENEELNLVLENDEDQKKPRQALIKRKPMSSVEKSLRLDIHKMHLCCLLVHVYIRNHWCNDKVVHRGLRQILTKKAIMYLTSDDTRSQFQRSRSFMDGLELASEAFRTRFKITAKGMSRPAWAESPKALSRWHPSSDSELPIQREDFRSTAKTLSASRDTGAQLFCALLRSVGVDARLVCSLQTLPFNSGPTYHAPQAKYAAFYSAEGTKRVGTPERVSGPEHSEKPNVAAIPSLGSLGGSNRFDPSPEPSLRSSASKTPRRPIRQSKYPVYWIEAFNEAVQKWVPVDPLVTKTIAKPSKIEPPAGEQDNSLTYVLAFEDDSSVHDVTRRYAKAYNAKTRRDRVESTKGGDRWWRGTMKSYVRNHPLDRDQLEAVELSNKEAAEPMPRSVQDFKDHPYYALERHMRRLEVIHPKKEVGKVSSGKSESLESIYRRRDVHNVQSGDRWYRMGREIKPGEQPLKRVTARRARVESPETVEESAGTALYAVYQTIIYRAPPVINGRVPKNVYGNLDIYVPSMIPAGGYHSKQPETARAAKTLAIDFADAVTGFVFKGRHGTAVTNGAVIASENREAVEAVIAAFEHERIEGEEEKRSREALRMWKRFLAGLRIRERIEGYDIEGERDVAQQTHSDADAMEEDEEAGGGGFFPGQEAGDIAEPTAGKMFARQAAIDMDQEEAGGFISDESESEYPTVGAARSHTNLKATQIKDKFLDNLDDDSGGGFVIQDDHDETSGKAMRDAKVANADVQDWSQVIIPEHAHSPSKSSRVIAQADLSQWSVGRQPKDFDSSGSELNDQHINRRSSAAPSKSDIVVGLTRTETEEARLLQQLYENQSIDRSNLTEPSEVASQAAAPIKSPQIAACKAASQSPPVLDSATEHPTRLSVPCAPVQPPSPASDKGSLLSEDPEDEDAEPDWLG